MNRRQFSFAALITFLWLAACCNPAGAQTALGGAAPGNQSVSDKFIAIHNDSYVVDQDGNHILTRSGCLCQFNGTFYWYGGNPRGFREQNCYSSTDLIHWTNRGVILRHDPDANRIDVLYNDNTHQYVMFLKYNGNGAHFGIATSDKPEGPFTFKTQTLIDNALIGDMSMFKDDDGKAYLCYVSWAVGTNAQHGIYRMSDDYLTPDKRMFLWDTRGREAPHIFKRNNIYYYGTSKTAGIRSSDTAYYTATNLEGPWSPAKPLSTPGSVNSWDSQVDFVYPIHGTQGTLYMYAGDRWVADAAHGRNGDYVWLPMKFDGDTPSVDYYQDWELNLATAAWRPLDPSRNLAAGKSVTSSSEDGTNSAKHVTDAKTFETYAGLHWDSAASDPQWISVDLGSAMPINRVILRWGNGAAKNFAIQTSTDGSTWSDVYSSTHGAGLTVTDQTFDTTTARYVRMLGTQRAPVNAARGGGGFGGGRGRGAAGGTTRPATQFAGFPATQPARLTNYSLFDFMVLKD